MINRILIAGRKNLRCAQHSPPRYNSDNLQPITVGELSPAEFGRSNSLAVMLHDYAAGQKLLREQKRFNGARQVCFNRLAVGDDHGFHS